MGAACASPGIGVCQRMFSPVVTFHAVGNGEDSSSPLALRPRYCGQFAAEVNDHPASRETVARSGVNFFMGRIRTDITANCKWSGRVPLDLIGLTSSTNRLDRFAGSGARC